MIVTTTDAIEGRQIVEVFGLVYWDHGTGPSPGQGRHSGDPQRDRR